MAIREKILIVEDERNICKFLTAVLSANNYDVLIAQTGAEAYTLITSHCPDLVLLDLGLPDIDWLSILTAVREWTQLPIIVVSARTQERDKVDALDKGADDYISKPFGTSELLARIGMRANATRIPAHPTKALHRQGFINPAS
jgi:two-component system KDP operon response regulator KdpE